MASAKRSEIRRWGGVKEVAKAARPTVIDDHHRRAQALRELETRAAETLAAERSRRAERKVEQAMQQVAARQAVRAAAVADRRAVLVALGYALALTAATEALNVVAPDPKYWLMVRVLCGVTVLAAAVWLGMRIDHLLRYRGLSAE